MPNMDTVKMDDIKSLTEFFSKQTYCATANDDQTNSILLRCIQLLERDYSVALVPNNNGELCANYPSQIPILEYEKVDQKKNLNLSPQTNAACESVDVQKTHDIFHSARLARCRTRFPIPVILYKGKHICRSSTLSRGFEMYGRASVELFDDYMTRITGTIFKSIVPRALDDETETTEKDGTLEGGKTLEGETLMESDDLYEYSFETSAKPEDSATVSSHFYDQVRHSDIELLKRFNIETIMDLMVENKKVKYGMYCSSSEKVERPFYVDFNLISIPYPGCEFFKNFREQNFEADHLIFDWGQEQCDASLDMSQDPLHADMNIEWSNYKSWDLVTLTQNYMKYILKHFQDNTTGILVHCISGWDRTPLFISLLRLSLWADGLIHKNLDELEILYLTIAYDWMLFGHNLANRLAKGEEVFFFCFYMLKHLTSKDFSTSPERHKIPKNTSVEDVNHQMGLMFGTELEESNSPGSSESFKFLESRSSSSNTDECNGNGLDVKSERTSPIFDDDAMPERAESSSSIFLDDFLLVAKTGSFKDVSTMDNYETARRHRRLTLVREYFYLCYFQSGVANVKYAPDSFFAKYLSGISEKLGYNTK